MRIFGRPFVSPVFVWWDRYMDNALPVRANVALSWHIGGSDGTTRVRTLELRLYWQTRLAHKLELGWRPDVTWQNWNNESYLRHKRSKWTKEP